MSEMPLQQEFQKKKRFFSQAAGVFVGLGSVQV
jgi:hypothetical protein